MLRKIQFCLLAGLLASPVFAQQKAVDYVNPTLVFITIEQPKLIRNIRV